MNNRIAILIIILVSALLLVGCKPQSVETQDFGGQVGFDVVDPEEQPTPEPTTGIPPGSKPGVEPTPEPIAADNWRDWELVDINTGNSFKVSDFKGTPILLESFAVWCPTCTSQQREIRKLHAELGDSFVSISLDTDPFEDEQRVKDHLDKQGFDWRYAISPQPLTTMLIDEFGLKFVNAPQAPIVLVCEDQTARMLDSGLKRVAELKAEIEAGC